MSDKLIVIVGITGQQGGSVARVFQSLPGWRIRGITRKPDRPSIAQLREAGTELVAGDLDDPASLDRAFEGANAIFAVTDFWQFLSQPSTHQKAAQENLMPNQVAMDLEIQQGKNIIDAAFKHLGTLERFVFSTLSDSEKWSKGEIKWNLHFDGKARYCDYLKATYPDLAKRTSYLQMGYYLNNWRLMKQGVPQKLPDGSFIIPVAGLPNGKPIPYVDPPNDTGHFVKALVLHPQAEQSMLGYCDLRTPEAYTALWAQVCGVKATYVGLSLEQMIQSGLPEFLALEASDSGRYVTTWGWDGGDPDVKHPEELGVEMSKLTKLEDSLRKEDWSSVL